MLVTGVPALQQDPFWKQMFYGGFNDELLITFMEAITSSLQRQDRLRRCREPFFSFYDAVKMNASTQFSSSFKNRPRVYQAEFYVRLRALKIQLIH